MLEVRCFSFKSSGVGWVGEGVRCVSQERPCFRDFAAILTKKKVEGKKVQICKSFTYLYDLLLKVRETQKGRNDIELLSLFFL